MKIGDLVVCGENEDLGIIIAWDDDGDPIVWQFVCHFWDGAPAAIPVYKDRVRVL